jgi:WD40 repeat protein
MFAQFVAVCVRVACRVLLRHRCVAHLVGHTKHVYDLSVSPNGEQVVSGSGDETIRRWQLPAGFDAKATLVSSFPRLYLPSFRRTRLTTRHDTTATVW